MPHKIQNIKKKVRIILRLPNRQRFWKIVKLDAFVICMYIFIRP